MFMCVYLIKWTPKPFDPEKEMTQSTGIVARAHHAVIVWY